MSTRRQSGILDGDNAVTFARLMQIVGLPILLFMSGWMFNTLNDIAARVVRLEEQMKAGADDRYRGTQAHSDFALRDAQIATMQERLQNMEQRFITTGQRLNGLEDRISRMDHQAGPQP